MCVEGAGLILRRSQYLRNIAGLLTNFKRFGSGDHGIIEILSWHMPDLRDPQDSWRPG
jgi:hypothetical protein